MPIYTDQTGSAICLTAPARRIISLVPSQTEFLFSLGLDAEVIGITRFCVHPEE
jgi:ABC-type Fe3+-hydroxamate transport system substrate-binding protein